MDACLSARLLTGMFQYVWLRTCLCKLFVFACLRACLLVSLLVSLLACLPACLLERVSAGLLENWNVGLPTCMLECLNDC